MASFYTAIEAAKQRVMEDQCSPTASLQTSVVDTHDSDTERSKRSMPILENFMPLKRRWEKQTKSENNGPEGADGPDSELQQHKVVLGRPAWMGEAQLWTKHSQGIDHEVTCSLILNPPTKSLTAGCQSFISCPCLDQFHQDRPGNVMAVGGFEI